jgi:hypothetical protein
MGKKLSSADLRNPTVSNMGAHSHEYDEPSGHPSLPLMPTSIESIPSLSITKSEQSLLKPAQVSLLPLLMHDTDPDAISLAESPSNKE